MLVPHQRRVSPCGGGGGGRGYCSADGGRGGTPVGRVMHAATGNGPGIAVLPALPMPTAWARQAAAGGRGWQHGRWVGGVHGQSVCQRHHTPGWDWRGVARQGRGCGCGHCHAAGTADGECPIDGVVVTPYQPSRSHGEGGRGSSSCETEAGKAVLLGHDTIVRSVSIGDERSLCRSSGVVLERLIQLGQCHLRLALRLVVNGLSASRGDL